MSVRRRTVGMVAVVAAAASGVATWWSLRPAVDLHEYVSRYEQVLGTSLDLTVIAETSAQAEQAEAAVLEAIDRDARILSSYDPASEFSRWFATAGTAVPVSRELAEVLALFDEWRGRTGGALDPAAERISQLWRSAAAEGRVPTADERRQAVVDVRQQHWTVDRGAGTATHTSSTPLMLNSFTKSYIVDRAARAGLSAGARGIVVNVGGDLVVAGERTERVDIRDPLAPADNARPLTTLSVGNRTVATSGGYHRGVTIGGTHYSHIVDPRTAEPVRRVSSATVVADRAVDAGALATALCVLDPVDGARLASEVAGAEFLMVLEDGSRVESAGWRALEVVPVNRLALPHPVATLHAADQSWDANYEVAVTLELARITTGRAARPYVAVWIEDADRFPVKTLVLWYQKPRWLPDLRAWSRADRLRALAEGTSLVNSVSSATRAAGRYTLTWDGRDNQGKLVKPGTYAVSIEVAREHGTYQIMRQTIEMAGKPQRVDLPGNVEVASASIEYRRVAGR